MRSPIVDNNTISQKTQEKPQEKMDLENIVMDISRLLTSRQNLNIESILGKLAQAVSVNRCYIFEFKKNYKVMNNTYTWCSVNQAFREKEKLQNINSEIFNWWINKLRKREIIIINDITVLPNKVNSQKNILKLEGIKALLVIPLYNDVKLVGFLGFEDTEKTRDWSKENIKLLEIVGDMIIRYWQRKKQERQLFKTNKILEESIDSIVSTLSYVTGIRDPYTADHEKRVAILAETIAQKLNLSPARCKTIRIASLLHDIGKIKIPAELLTNPGNLTELEYKIIQQHPETGFELLKNAKINRTIKKIVLQHHERLDGSGYPFGLTKKMILKETMIIAVADVVEAMSSHRPYRPALGIEAALEEINKHKGKKYNAEVVEKCTMIFANNKDFFTSNLTPDKLRT
ncbi:MAG: HD domain-containing protein [Halanaerobiales bacterium]|nr:HD domain-containing protein [Halanaerobiales bacterium]